MILSKRIPIVQNPCSGIYLRWWFNGWHYYHFTNTLEIKMETSADDMMTTKVFSIISRIERATKIRAKYSYIVQLDGIGINEIDGFANILIAERVEQYDGGSWYEIDVTRGDKTLRTDAAPAYQMEFEITRKELPNTPAVFQKSQYFYIADVLTDMDDGEVIAMNKQVNDIAELQDRQSDFTASFKIRKTRRMRELFQLAGDPGATTTFPFIQQSCRLVVDGIEVITDGRMVLLSVDDQYYNVSVYSGNINFFTESAKLKINQLVIPSTNHTWNAAAQYGSQIADLDYLYPLIEPSDDGGIIPLTDDNASCMLIGDKVWPFVKVRAIWDAIFTGLGYTSTGKILDNATFNAMFMPIVNRNAGDVSRYLFSLYNNVTYQSGAGTTNFINIPGNVAVNGADDPWWYRYNTYYARLSGKHKFRIYIIWSPSPHSTIQLNMWFNAADVPMTLTETETAANGKRTEVWTGELDMLSGDSMFFRITKTKIYYFDMSVTSIENPLIGYGTAITPMLNMPQITQSEFIKMICNMFALVPEANPRTRTVRFWSYADLYENIAIARDWSSYLSERDDEISFKFGDYAQHNFMKYKDTDDVIPANGTGMMQINDENLPDEKNMITVPVSYSDECLVLNGINVSRINMNIYDAKSDTYNMNDKIEPRIVHVSAVDGRELIIKELGGFELEYTVADPRKGSSIEISFGSLGVNYASLANMLFKTNLRRAKFNLPVYEIAGLRHDVPVYLSQYKSYFYVNKVNNYVAGKLCAIDLIKL